MENLQDFLPIILGIVISIVVIAFILRGTMKRLKGSSPVPPMEEALQGLWNQISWIPNVLSVHQDGFDIVVYLECYPSTQSLSFIPLFYQGYRVTTKLFDEVAPITLK